MASMSNTFCSYYYSVTYSLLLDFNFFFSLQDLLDVFLDGSPKTSVLKISYVKAFSLQYTHILGEEWLVSTRSLLAKPSMVHHVFLCEVQMELLLLFFSVRIQTKL